MGFEPLQGAPVRFPPGRVIVRLRPELWPMYRALYNRYVADLPVLQERDFRGGQVKMTPAHLKALNRAISGSEAPSTRTGSLFEVQEQGRTGLFKRTQYLS